MTQHQRWPAGGYDGSQPGGPGDDFSDLDSFSDGYKPQHAFRLGIESLADATYDFEIISAVLEKTPKTDDRICRINLKVGGGQLVEWTHWLNRTEGVNSFSAELAALGMDADRWNTPGRPLSKEIPAAVAKLPGIKFRGVKSSRKDTRPGMTDKTYHDLRISCRFDNRSMPPLQPPTNSPVAPWPAAAPPAIDPRDIPF